MNKAKMAMAVEVIAEKIQGLLQEQSEAIAAAYEAGFAECEDPTKFKFPLGMKAVLTPYGPSGNAITVEVAWSVRHKVSTDPHVMGQGDMFAEES